MWKIDRRLIMLSLCLVLSWAAYPCCYNKVSVVTRQKLQHTQHQLFSNLNESVWLQRWLFSYDFEVNRSNEFFVEAIVATDEGRSSGSDSIDENIGDIHQLWWRGQIANASVILGRQIWSFENQRQIGNREGTNVRRRFDGLRVISNNGNTEFYAGFHVESKLAPLSDSANHQQFISGIRQKMSVNEQDYWQFNFIRYRDERHSHQALLYSLTIDYFHYSPVIDFNIESILQWGEQHQQNVQAYWLYSRLAKSYGSFNVYTGLSYASGDPNPYDGKKQSFEPMFAKAPFYSEAGIFSTSNLKSLFFGSQVSPWTNTQVELEWHKIWQIHLLDSLYTTGSQRLFPVDEKLHYSDIYTVRIQSQITQQINCELVFSFLHQNGHALISDHVNSSFLEAGFTYVF